MIKKTVILISFILGTLTFAASAQTAADRAKIADTFGFGPRLGYYEANDAVDGNFFGGIQARFRPGAIVGIEAAVEYRARQTFGIGEENLVETSFIPITGSLLLFAPITDFVSPYALGGVGVYYTIHDTDGIIEDIGFEGDSSFEVGYHLGLGLEFPFSPNVALNVDYRYIFLDPDNDDLDVFDATFDGNAISAGIMFYF